MDQSQATAGHDNGSSHDRGSQFSFFRHVSSWFDFMRNISPDQDPAMAFPIRISLPGNIGTAVYCFSRLYILIEDIIGLSALPASAYEVVDYGPYSPIL